MTFDFTKIRNVPIHKARHGWISFVFDEVCKFGYFNEQECDECGELVELGEPGELSESGCQMPILFV